MLGLWSDGEPGGDIQHGGRTRQPPAGVRFPWRFAAVGPWSSQRHRDHDAGADLPEDGRLTTIGFERSEQRIRSTGRATMSRSEQMRKIKTEPGFIAALDQSGGSTPHALALYGIKDHAWKDDD